MSVTVTEMRHAAHATGVLLPHHADLILASAISPEVAAVRGYRSATMRGELEALGFAPYQAITPALVVPIFDPTGRIVLHQIRPDRPRTNADDKPVKYETPKGARMVLDVPPAVRAQIGDSRVPLLVTEGIRKADSLVTAGACCIALLGVDCWRGTNSAGDKTPLAAWDSIALHGRDVFVVFDSDAAQNEHVQGAENRLAQFLTSRGAHVRICRIPAGVNGAKVGADDYLAAGGSLSALLGTAAATRTSVASVAYVAPAGAKRTSVASVAYVAPEWPKPLGDMALYGLAGDFVRTIEPHTEADPVALLLDFVTSFGNVIGRSAYFEAEADRHFGNLFVGLVGVSSKGRKGSSHGQVVSRFRAVDETWASTRLLSGLSSGEGAIWCVRDPIVKHEAIKQQGVVVGYQDVQVDEGVEDKRLLIFEPELASVLRVMARDGSTLSAVLRLAWDTGTLRTLTKNSPASATDAHVSLLGHVTKDELLRYLDSTEVGNGFANRFLWACVRRSKLLPEGGSLTEADLEPIVRRLHNAVDFTRKGGALIRDNAARDLWIETYSKLSEGLPGMLGAVTGRAEAQTMRLALLYALLDCSAWIERPHLEAALEVWRYCLDSARFIFGDAVGDPDADAILNALREARDGLNRTQIRDLFGRHRDSAQVDRALTGLAERGLVIRVREDTGGRPRERWIATSCCDISDKSDESSGVEVSLA